MGVPSFYRWLVNKYPSVRVNAIEARGDGVDTSSPNPNGMEFDNLYLDMNGIIHPCFHPEDQSSAPTTYEDVFDSIYDYIDHLFSIVRPRKLLYIAIDGVAPRAKMNQQRSRRFRTAKDDEIAAAEENRLRIQFEMEGKPVLPKVESEVSDSNVITPGTEFMYRLSKELEDFIHSRLNNDPGWKGIQVILSDANVPGEGEHKIMSFIRYQRSIPGYNCNTHHCLYGLDADLIMLALATHEVHFSILREDVLMQEQRPVVQPAPKTSNQVPESYSLKSREWFKDVKTEGGWFKDADRVDRYVPPAKTPYEFLRVWILREYLELDMKITDAPDNFTFDLERIIDDFIFMCFFMGNDFLPHMPTLEIHERAMDLLMTVYKDQFKSIGGYLVDMRRAQDKKGGYVKLKRVENFILLVGTYEEKIFKKRSELRDRRLRRLCQDADIRGEGNEIEYSEFPRSSPCSNPGERTVSLSAEEITLELLLRNTKDLKEKLKENLHKKSDLLKNGDLDIDKVKLGMAGWKERYYKQKFSAETSQQIEIMRKEIVQKYTEGLLWVLQYYFSGVPSWSWFYPYHYGPFASDLKGLSQVRVKFQQGHPFKPFDQLMSVLPPRSAHALPKPYSKLITDKDSRIIDFYPTDFGIDTDGKRYASQGICKLPFIDEERLKAETRRVEKELTQEESERNVAKNDQLFVHRLSNLGTTIWTPVLKASSNGKIKMDANLSGIIGGFIWLRDYDHLTSAPSILSLLFELPDGNLHIPRPLEAVKYPARTISAGDIQKIHLWHESGSRPPYNNRPESQAKCTEANSTSQCQPNHISRKLSSDQNLAIHEVAGTGWGGAGRGATASYISVVKGTADLKLPESSHNFGSYGRGQTAINTFRPSTNASTQSLNHTWRPSLQANSNPSSQGLGRGRLDSKNGRNSAWKLNPANASSQGQGRGQFLPSTSASRWHSRDSASRFS